MKEWKINSGVYIGTSHEIDKIPCQDSVTTLNLNGVNAIVLSDGCGSAKYSEYGSKLATKVVSEYLVNNFDELYSLSELDIKKTITNIIINDVLNLIKNNRNIVDNYVNSEKGSYELQKYYSYDFSKNLSQNRIKEFFEIMLFDGTILFAVVKDNKYIIGHCGDGFIIGHKNNEFIILSEEIKKGAKNITTYPSTILAYSESYKNDSRFSDFRIIKGENNPYDGFILLSDGSENSLIYMHKVNANNAQNLFDIVNNETEKDANKFITEVLKETYREKEIEDGMYQGSDDDVSVAVMLLVDDEKINKNIEVKEEDIVSFFKEETNLFPFYISIGKIKSEIFMYAYRIYEKKKCSLDELMSLVKQKYKNLDDDDLLQLKYYFEKDLYK